MRATQNHINKFLEETRENDFDKYELLIELRNIVLEVFPMVSETFKYGGIMFSLSDDFGGLFVSKNHVSFELTYGYKLTSKLKLEGRGKYRRHLKVKVLSDALENHIKALLAQIGTIDKN